jgi:glycerate 2-kinase
VSTAPRALLLSLWEAAVAAVSVGPRFEDFLPPPRSGRVVIVGAGKAAAAMAVAAARYYGKPAQGVVVTRTGHGLKSGESSGAIRIIEARHPVPDAAGLEAGKRVLAAVRGLSSNDLVLCLLSGGGSALLEHPLPGIALDDIAAINRALLASGAAIGEINCVRKHLSAVKGGRLALAAAPARVVTLAISDVPGDDPSVIASGPTVADPTASADARAILKRYGIAVPPSVAAVLNDPLYETPKPNDPRLRHTEYRLVATQADALAAAARLARAQGFAVIDHGTRIEGEAREVAQVEAKLALDAAEQKGGTLILGGGELTVTLSGEGSGGPNREYALALALALNGHPRIFALAADTDGIDGTDDAAGAIVTPDTLARAAAHGLDARAALGAHDSGGFFAKLGDALVTGPTRTNVSDFRAILIVELPPHASSLDKLRMRKLSMRRW